MSAETLTWLIQNWDKVGVSLLMFIILVGTGFLFFTDRLASPKALAKLYSKIETLEGDCKNKDDLADKAADALVEARVLNTAVSTKLEYLEKDQQRLILESTECKRQLETQRLEASARERWSQQFPPMPKTEGQI